MAKYEVLHTYHDVERNELLKSGVTVEMTVSRADEVNKGGQTGYKKDFLKRLDEPKKQAEPADEEKSTDTKADDDKKDKKSTKKSKK